MSKTSVRLVLNRSGVRALLKSPEAMAVCKEHADATQSALGGVSGGYTVTTRTGKTRVNAEVAAYTQKARKECFENNTILKALR